MRLTARLWLLGALLPSALTLAVMMGAGRRLRGQLEAGLDRALLAQAAIESVSLFDGPSGRAHLHMASSPLVETVRPFAPVGSLFGPDGALVMRYPPPRDEDERRAVAPLLPGRSGDAPQLESRVEADGMRRRDLTLTVASPRDGLYTLRLSASLAQVDAAVATFYRVALSLAGLFMVTLLLLQTAQARRLARRLHSLGRHMAALREGQLEVAPPPDGSGDEIAALRDVIAEATYRLRAARQAQERLIADAAHELRTPLTRMRTSIDLALRRRRDEGELREALEETRREVDRLALLAGRLLDLAAIGPAGWDRKPGDLRTLLEEATCGARGEAEARGVLIQLRDEAPEQPALSRFDAGALRQAVDNLLSNAIKFSPPSGLVEVVLSRRQGRVRVRVADQGPGIAKEEREAVFAPFRRARRDGPGAGLGLTITREIVERHGGKVWVEDSAVGAALVFELEAGNQLDRRAVVGGRAEGG